jgi:hypothetical protein
MKIDEEEGHLLMWDHVTDPDMRKYLQFAKTSQRPNFPTSQPQ